MPTYEYECKKCGHNFEAFQQMSAAPLKKCPRCSGNLKRLIGAGSGIIFKGSGFYATDYKKSGNGGKKCPMADANKPECKSRTEADK